MKQQYKKFLKLLENLNEEQKNLALSHSSYANEHGTESNERLEYLGDSVLGLCVSEFLYRHLNKAEGKLSTARSELVRETTLARIAKEMELNTMLKVGKSFNNKPISDAMIADMVESIIGALYLTYNLKQVKTAIYEMLNIKCFVSQGAVSHDYKTELHEKAHVLKQKIDYDCSLYTTKGGQNNYRCDLILDKKKFSYGTGSNKKEAEQNAAKSAIKKLAKKSN